MFYVIFILAAVFAFGATLTGGTIPSANPVLTGPAVTPNFPTPDKDPKKNLQLYTFGYISGDITPAPTLPPTPTSTPNPTQTPTPTPTLTPTRPPTLPPTLPPTFPPTRPPTLPPTLIPTLPPLPTPTPTRIPIPTRIPTPTPVPRCPWDDIKTPGCGACFPEFEALACDEEVCENGDRKQRLLGNRDINSKKYCIYIEHRNPALYDRKKTEPQCVEACIAKPVIYLYPLVPTSIDVKVTFPGRVYISDPLYPKDGWKDVLAYPNGTLTYQGKTYHELYYESDVDKVNPPDNGIVIAKKDLKIKLTEATTQLGLRDREQQEFLEYWLPELDKLDAPFILFSIIDPVEKERIDHVDFTPQPDTFIAFLAYFKPLKTSETNVKPLILPESPPERIGFTAVEWGGTIDH